MNAAHSSRIAVVGDLALDIYFDVRDEAGSDEKIYSSGSRRDLGGTGANAAATILALGGRPTLYGLVGTDAIGDAVLSLMLDRGLPDECVGRVPGPTMVAIIVLRANQREVFVDRGVADEIPASAVVDIGKESDLVYMTGVPLSTARSVIAHHGSVPAVLGLEPRQISVDNARDWLDVWGSSLLMITNRAGQRALADAGAWPARSDGLPGPVAVTSGAAGVVYIDDRGGRLVIKALPVTAVDATGAGDCFAGTLCHFLCEGESTTAGVRLAVAAAGLSTMHVGSQNGLPSESEVRAAARELERAMLTDHE